MRLCRRFAACLTVRGWRAQLQDAFRCQRLDLRLAHRHDVNGFSHRVKHFKRATRFLSGLAVMVFDNGGHVTAPKPVLGHPPRFFQRAFGP